MLKLKFQPSIVSIKSAMAYIDAPEAKMVMMANAKALKPRVFSSKRRFRYSGTDRAREP
jgi:hypothetical protein